MRYELVKGPLDGDFYEGEIFKDKPYLVFEVNKGSLTSYALYKIEGDKLIYVSSKTRDQLLG